MKILITGVAGLLGSRLADWILKNVKNVTIVGVDDLSGGYIENIPDKVEFIAGDLVDQNFVNKIFESKKPDIVYHFAAYAAEGLSPFIRTFNYNNNLITSANLITNSIKHDVKRFIFTSSMAVYGDHKPPFHEGIIPTPIDPYGVAKFAVEQDLKIAYDQHGLKYTIIRPHNFYGVNQNIWDKYRNVLGIWMYQLMNNIQPTIFGDGNQTRAFSYVDDSLVPFWIASQNDACINETINLGGIKECSINDAYVVLKKVIGTDVNPVYLEKRHEVKHAWCSYEKSVNLLNFEHKVDLEEGLTKMWKWAKHQPNRKRKLWKNYELEKELYTYWRNK